MPFGMVQLSPDTRIDNWDGSSGYHYSDSTIYGFSHTHLSGTGIPDGCDILLMPAVGSRFLLTESQSAIGRYGSKFSHTNEKAEPGYYSVKLDDDEIRAELTATPRVGMHRYSFPKTDSAKIMLDLIWRDKLIDSLVRVDSVGRRIEGYRSSSSWAKNQKVFFSIEFSKHFSGLQTDAGTNSNDDWKNKNTILTFDARDGRPIIFKVAISFVSIEGARKNLEAELPHWDFDKVRADARSAWNKELSKIEVSGGTPEQTTNFYTALYHTMIHPSIFNDVDGKYKGLDGKVHQLPGYAAQPPYLRRSSVSPKDANKNIGGSAAEQRRSRKSNSTLQRKSGAFPLIDGQSPPEHYTVFSLWDTFRAAHPLYTIIDQRRTVDFINTFIRQYEQGGRLPVWELWGEETDTMIGYHAVSVIADAMAKGIKGFDYQKAYRAAKHSAELDHFGLAAYKKRGYISMEDENESVSRTLEYAYNDWCIAEMARIMARQYEEYLRTVDKRLQLNKGRFYAEDYRKYSVRARYFENLFDSRVDFFVARKNGGFIRPFAPSEVNFGFTEGNSWQYSFFVPHDVSRLMELMGGREYFASKLEELFLTDQKLSGREQADLTGLIGQYAHGNEPSHHIPYLFSYAGMPWRTQTYVRKIMDEFYKPTPDGLIGNEDCGQMSAWYVMSASGFYSVTPGSPEYVFGTPLFPDMTYLLENGKKFRITAKNVSAKNIYIQSVKLNGSQYKKAFITHSDIVNGGLLEFEMGEKASTGAFDGFPVAGSSISSVAVPRIDFANRIFIASATPDAMIIYTTDGQEPSERNGTLYIEPIRYDSSKDMVVRVIAIDSEKNRSKVVEARFQKRPNDWSVKVASSYSTQYTGGGENAIVDGIRGTTNFASGEWQGIQGKPYEAVVDLQRETEIKTVGASFLQVAGPWIWMPDRVEFEVSSDGVNFARVAEIKPAFPIREMTPTIKEYRQKITPTKTRFVRIRAFNFGKIPAWHPGAGGDPWIFIDEIFID